MNTPLKKSTTNYLLRKLEQTSRRLEIAEKALDYIANAKHRSCQETGCTCTYDTAAYALKDMEQVKI